MKKPFLLFMIVLLAGCTIKNAKNPNDPYENMNRKIFKFNKKIDKWVMRPPAAAYRKVFPLKVRRGINNFYGNLHLLPSIVNDFLQDDYPMAYKDVKRFAINSTLGLGGALDIAKKHGLPYHSNDLGITLAKWGDKKSPYVVIPFVGPATIRDAVGLTIDYSFFTIFPYIQSFPVRYGLVGVDYVQIRESYIDKEPIIEESLDDYAFVRDAYMQGRKYQIEGEQPDDTDAEDFYIESEEPSSDIPDDDSTTPSSQTAPNTLTPAQKKAFPNGPPHPDNRKAIEPSTKPIKRKNLLDVTHSLKKRQVG